VNVKLQQAGSTNSIGFYILQGEGGRRKLTMFADELVGKGAFQRAPEGSLYFQDRTLSHLFLNLSK